MSYYVGMHPQDWAIRLDGGIYSKTRGDRKKNFRKHRGHSWGKHGKWAESKW